MIMKTGLALLVAGTMQAPAQTTAFELEACLARVITNLTYKPPTQAEFARAEKLFQHTLRGDQTAAQLKTNWMQLGFEFQELVIDGESLWLLSAPEGKELGRGWYLFRTNQEPAIALEAPHARNDIHTGVISLRIF